MCCRICGPTFKGGYGSAQGSPVLPRPLVFGPRPSVGPHIEFVRILGLQSQSGTERDWFAPTDVNS